MEVPNGHMYGEKSGEKEGQMQKGKHVSLKGALEWERNLKKNPWKS